MSHVPQGSVLGLLLFDVIDKDSNSGIKHTLSKFVDNTKVCGAAHTSHTGCHPERPRQAEQWAQENLMTFNKAKCKVLHLGHIKPHYKCKLGDVRIEHSPAKKGSVVLVDSSWK